MRHRGSRRRKCEGRGRNWTKAPISQAMPRVAGSQAPEARRKAWNAFSLRASRRNQPCRHLDFRCLASTTVREQISVVLTHQVSVTYDGSSKQQIQ